MSEPVLVEVPNAPAIPGLRFRRPRLPEDYPGVTAVFNAMARADGLEMRVTADRVAHWYEHTRGWDPLVDEVVLEVEGRIVGYADTRYVPDTDGTQVYAVVGAIDPTMRRRGLGTALLPFNEARARERSLAELGTTDGVVLHSWTGDDGAGSIALLERAGYSVARYFFDMVRPSLEAIPDMPWPAGIEVRPVVPADHRQIFDADAEAFRDHWGGIDESDAAFERFFSGPDFEPDLWRVAWDGREVAGVVMVERMPAYDAEHGTLRAEIGGVSVRRAWRGRGLARALVADALRGAREAGMTSATLGVDAQNPTGALGVYEAVGFEVSRRSRAYRKPLDGV
jgi:mycothiol synthase